MKPSRSFSKSVRWLKEMVPNVLDLMGYWYRKDMSVVNMMERVKIIDAQLKHMSELLKLKVRVSRARGIIHSPITLA